MVYGEIKIVKIGIIDADLIAKNKHPFPNLACMKISGAYKADGHDVTLLTDYDSLDNYDSVFLSKVFMNTPVPDWVLQKESVSYGGTGFYFDRAPPLPKNIEHCFPDYHLYDTWVSQQLSNGGKRRAYRYYTDYSIGFLTRGCFRKCSFCVNRGYDHVVQHSSLYEFLDNDRKRICLLDDNFFGCPEWKSMLELLQSTGKPFQFRQGLDIRLLDDEKCEMLFCSKYDGDYIFAFDDIADTDMIKKKIILTRKYTAACLKFYTFCGYDRNDRWDESFWIQDIFDLLERIRILMKYHCIPYITRYERYLQSPYRGMYVTIARWVNQPAFYKKRSLREFADMNGIGSSTYRYVHEFEQKYPQIAPYLDMQYEGGG